MTFNLQDTLTNLQSNINSLTSDLSNNNLDLKLTETTTLLNTLHIKIDEIIELYSNVQKQQNIVDVSNN